MLEGPFTYGEPLAAVQQEANGCSSGLYSLPYEFYKVMLPQVGLPLLEALNDMLEAGELEPSLQKGVIRLIPGGRHYICCPALAYYLAVHGLLVAHQDVDRLDADCLTYSPCSSQLRSICGHSIFEGPASILSAAEYEYLPR
jgi:hypothetical protein